MREMTPWRRNFHFTLLKVYLCGPQRCLSSSFEVEYEPHQRELRVLKEGRECRTGSVSGAAGTKSASSGKLFPNF